MCLCQSFQSLQTENSTSSLFTQHLPLIQQHTSLAWQKTRAFIYSCQERLKAGWDIHSVDRREEIVEKGILYHTIRQRWKKAALCVLQTHVLIGTSVCLAALIFDSIVAWSSAVEMSRRSSSIFRSSTTCCWRPRKIYVSNFSDVLSVCNSNTERLESTWDTCPYHVC